MARAVVGRWAAALKSGGGNVRRGLVGLLYVLKLKNQNGF
jgi:hypothetical protein